MALRQSAVNDRGTARRDVGPDITRPNNGGRIKIDGSSS